MIPNTKDREIVSEGVTESAVFGISAKDTTHIMAILRDTLYSDKVLAVLREYGSNAWDAHREVGKDDVPIKVTLPTKGNANLTIRDYGPGLSHGSVFEVYTQYGASTKRDSDNFVGTLGIGSKSGFAYSDSFTVTSWHGGKKTTYVAVLDQTDKGIINLLDEVDCGDETGIEIQIAVRPEDIWEFTDKAQKLFQHFVPRPKINVDLPELPSADTVLKNGIVLNDSAGNWTAIMGCVPYRVDLQQLKNPDGTSTVTESINQLSGCLNFKIGEVLISASREELKYNTRTKEALAKKFEVLIDEYVEHSLQSLDKDSLTLWEKKVRAQVFRELGLPVPEQWRHLIEEYATIKTAKTFTIIQNKSVVQRISIQSRSRLLLQDDHRDLQGYHLAWGDYIVKPNAGESSDDVKTELEAIVVSLGLTGIAIINISSLPWSAPYKPGKKIRVQNKKYQVTTFKFNPKARTSPKSVAWEIEKREPTPEDVYVVLESFKSVGCSFYHEYRSDESIVELFKGTMPIVYGYKTSDKKPIDPSKCVGTHYPVFRPKLIESIITPKVKRLLTHWWRANAFAGYNYQPQQKVHLKAYNILLEELGEFHPITTLIGNQRLSSRLISKLKPDVRTSLKCLGGRIEEDNSVTEIDLALERLYKEYPLLSLNSVQISALWESESKKWLEYVKLVDRALAVGLVTPEE